MRLSLPVMAELSKAEWIVPHEGAPTRVQFNALFKANGLDPPRRVVESSSLVFTRNMLQRSDRLGVLSFTQLRYEVETRQLEILPLYFPGTDRMIGVTTRKNWYLHLLWSAFWKCCGKTPGKWPRKIWWRI